ncbi:mandelate racemase/muconate lactonizing enzyme family protein [Lawsonibacter sp. OA9]|uniref:mandelate racemase/muconate lactonizing enzyme family protein n=1 Tax=Oscillospiraceae TaxID=216572 RepID=UPI001F057B55|nr:mandelate racemase/muconate lactonizing enzyme family protein [Lawsonibacter sp. OA9]MCH1978459.1 mandelate racemase/muconate lactonizing enzyme family protein [Lawsonibacter sp. OA9]
MVIEKIEVFPLKIKKEHVYLGNSSGLDSPYDYYLRPEYRCPYSKNMETVYVKLTTDTGISGWGEALAPVLPDVTGKIVGSLFTPVLLGADPLNIRVLWNELYDLMRDRGYYSGFMVDAITAVDCALWDIVGKVTQMPVYQLLGGAYRMSIPAYISGLPVEGLEEKVKLAQSWKDQGFQAIKLHIGYGMEEDIRIMTALRKALGADYKLMIDAHWNYTVAQAVKLARKLEDLDVEFLECPLNPEDLNGYAELSAAVDIPVALGESDRTHWQYKDILDKKSCDILQPDVGRCGITELMRIAELAELYGRPVAPHLSVGQAGCIAATLHCDAAMYNFYGMQEYQPSIVPVANEFLVRPIVCENGHLRLPDGPGLGIEFDEDKIKYYSMN